jgi:hypothetical protein
MTSFQVGDRVRVSRETHKFFGNIHNRTGTVVKTQNDSTTSQFCFVKLDQPLPASLHDFYNKHTICLFSYKLEPISVPKITTTRKKVRK